MIIYTAKKGKVKMNIIARFAPSPTGHLHLGNIRTALVNWLFVNQNKGKFILRIDDTDKERSKEEYFHGIVEDLTWLGLNYDELVRQSDRTKRYDEIKDRLITEGRLYPCFETKEELDMKRKTLLSRGLPPIYDRAALKLSKDEIENRISQGEKAHYRFKLDDEVISWSDLVRGEISFDPRNLGDPILIREDNSMTYMLCSCIDDIDMSISHVFRGEDHISNTAIGVQLHRAIGGGIPLFAHLSLLKTKTSGMSKRDGGFDIKSLRENFIEPMAINSLLARLGTAQTIEPHLNMEKLIKEFDIGKFGKAAANYDYDELLRLNHKILSQSNYKQKKNALAALGCEVDERFFNAVKSNINIISEIKQWYDICRTKITPVIASGDKDFLMKISKLLPLNIDENSWDLWLREIKKQSERKGKELFMPIRKAITGAEHGPELKIVLPLIDREVIVKRLEGVDA